MEKKSLQTCSEGWSAQSVLVLLTSKPHNIMIITLGSLDRSEKILEYNGTGV